MMGTDTEKISVFVCGVQKGGTTSLHSHFDEHRDLQNPREKEIHFFDDETVNWADPDYGRLHSYFSDPAGSRLRCDITPIYQFWPESLHRIALYNPLAKLIFLFRDPFERALSHWAMEYARGAENLDFASAIREGRQRLAGLPRTSPKWRVFSYLERGLYGQQVAEAKRYFSDSQLLFLRSEDLRNDHASALKQIQQFLGISAFPDTGAKRAHGRYATPGTAEPTEADLALVAEFVVADMQKFTEICGLDVSSWPTQKIGAGAKIGSDLQKIANAS